MESEKLVMESANFLSNLSGELGIKLIFKSSFDKANRTDSTSFRSAGLEEGLRLLQKVKDETELAVITDIHETYQVSMVADVADVLQIPAFLCRQTDLLTAAGRSGRPVNIKKGQFMSPAEMEFALKKVQHGDTNLGFITERGTSFGYNDLVVDFRSLPIMRRFSAVVYDVTHSIQQPGALNGKSGGQSWLAPHLARAAVAIGVDGLFIETHPNPSEALSDGPNMIPHANLEEVFDTLLAIRAASREPEESSY